MLRKIAKIIYISPPLLTMLWASPAVFGLSFDILVVPSYLGLLIWPAYIYVLFYEPRKVSVSIKKLIWIRVSLYGAMGCSLFGIFIGYMLPFLSPLSFITLLMSGHLLYRFEKGR